MVTSKRGFGCPASVLTISNCIGPFPLAICMWCCWVCVGWGGGGGRELRRFMVEVELWR